jgi:SAM-dependent methyltransferase
MGHTLDLGPLRIEGLLGRSYLTIAGLLDAWNWWPRDLAGASVADIGCFSGGLSALLSSRGPRQVLAVDEIPEHLAQCDWLVRASGLENIKCLAVSLYDLPHVLTPSSLDLILLSGVLYHLSDMLVGLLATQTLLKGEGLLIMECNAVECLEHSYANFGRFAGGMWWQPTALCIRDMCEFMGFETPEIRFYTPNRCLVRAVRPSVPLMPFRRGLNWSFANRLDERPRTTDLSIMAPAPCTHP